MRIRSKLITTILSASLVILSSVIAFAEADLLDDGTVYLEDGISEDEEDSSLEAPNDAEEKVLEGQATDKQEDADSTKNLEEENQEEDNDGENGEDLPMVGWSGAEQIKDLKGASSTEGSVLTWSAVPEAEGYLIGAIQNGKPYKQIDFIMGGNNTRYVDKNASLTDYSYYWVFPYKKVDGKVVRGNASSRYVYGIKQLPAPQNLKATGVTGAVNLGWNAVPDADGYTIKCRKGSSGDAVVIADVTGTSFSDKTASTTDNSFYWVYAYKKSGDMKRPGVISNYAFGKAKEIEKLLSTDTTSLTMKSGEQRVVNISFTGQGQVSYKNSNKAVVTAEFGAFSGSTCPLVLTGKGIGTAYITISNSINAETVVVSVTVQNSMAVDQANIDLVAGESKIVTMSVIPSDNSFYSASSADYGIAKADVGNIGGNQVPITIEGRKVGKTTITVKNIATNHSH